MAKKITKRGDKEAVSLDLIALESGKKPPQAPDMEEAVLGALLVEPEAINDVRGTLIPECFYKNENRKIYEAILDLSARHAQIDIYSVAEELNKRGELEEVGGSPYLAMLSNKISAAAHIEYHTQVLVQKYIQRELIRISYEVIKESFEDNVPVDDLLDKTQQSIFTLTDRNMSRDYQSISDILSQVIDDLQKDQERGDGLSGVPSGYTGIDRVTLGWQPSDLIIIAARPSVGKTAFVLTMARNVAVEHNIPVAFFSLEMSAKQLAKRLVISETGLSATKIKGGKKLEEHEWTQLNEKLNALSKAPIYVDETPSLSIYEFRSKARRLVTAQKVELIIIDYLQLMTGPKDLRGMREQEVSAISRSLKAIAKELDVPIIALSQLSRAVETRGGEKRPQLSDLRESGAIEQDADIVMFIHRPDYYGLDKDTTTPGYTEIIIAKHRNGEVKDVPMRFRNSEVKFVDAGEVTFDVDSTQDGNRIVGSRMNEDFENSDF